LDIPPWPTLFAQFITLRDPWPQRGNSGCAARAVHCVVAHSLRMARYRC